MKHIKISNKKGITLHTAGTLVNDDIKVTLDDSIKAVEGVSIEVATYGAKDLIIDGSKDFSGIIVDGYNGNLLINNSANREQRTNVNIAGFVEVNLNDEHEYNLITSKNLEPQNIAKDITILGVTGTFQGGTDTTDATATSSDILLGKTAYVNDVKVEGTIETYTGENEGGDMVPESVAYYKANRNKNY